MHSAYYMQTWKCIISKDMQSSRLSNTVFKCIYFVSEILLSLIFQNDTDMYNNFPSVSTGHYLFNFIQFLCEQVSSYKPKCSDCSSRVKKSGCAPSNGGVLDYNEQPKHFVDHYPLSLSILMKNDYVN